jgi:hypothetical protein
MLKWIAQNKYKLMAFIIGLYIVVDVVQHKGQTRVLFPENFPVYQVDENVPKAKNILINTDKEWKKAVNTINKLNALSEQQSGIECDVFFNMTKNSFEVHHDWDKPTGLGLEELFNQYKKRNLSASIWLDFKNLNDSNAKQALTYLIQLKNKFDLQNKLLVESNRTDLLNNFADSGFFTSYYTPMFNPYKLKDEEMKFWVDSLTFVIKNSKVNALSGYYFQYPFLHHYFPQYPILIWSANDRFSLINWLYKRKISRDKSVFIALYP